MRRFRAQHPDYVTVDRLMARTRMRAIRQERTGRPITYEGHRPKGCRVIDGHVVFPTTCEIDCGSKALQRLVKERAD